ncbi:outer membrane protein assembly factor BamB family protein [Amycolatopsis sp. H20-H5]|uniref:outer membrane protein assembly factor BamB family protein n=1 Tax=Amycolatopsis sp. H20-H5 TaxID=3046309 RepID=UPI002DBEBC54|nr:PQQ-binding-like beta-propeller repeat protein [Amycolatopsis sp. H20-H5]MEC3977538.1 PQQ-binding-like beta-propeller repeat protein [Amycolatopsis sp. H20-H5]
MRRTVVTLACLGLMAVAGGCGSGSGGQASGPVSGTSPVAPSPAAPEAKTADPPTEFDDKAVALPSSALRANLGGEIVSKFVSLRDRTAYIVTPDALIAVDALTGRQTWTTKIDGKAADPNAQSGPFVNPVGPLPPMVTEKLAVAAVPTAVPEQGTTPGYTALTVVATGTTTGAKAWQADVKVADDSYGGGGQSAISKVAAVTDKVVVASYHRDEDNLTVGLDAQTGKTLWDRKDYDAGAASGDVLVGTDYNVAENSSMVQATALDVATGKQLWTGATRSSAVVVVPSDPGLAVVKHTDYDSGEPSMLFLDPASGTEKSKLTRDYNYAIKDYGDCLYDQQSVLVCTVDSQVTAYDAKTAKKLWALPDSAANRVAPRHVATVWHGALYGTTNGGAAIVLDAKTGKDISSTPGVTPSWVSEYAGIGVDKDGAPQAYPVKK